MIVAALGWLNPAVAALLMVASSAIVIGNSLRLRQPLRRRHLELRRPRPRRVRKPRRDSSVPLALGIDTAMIELPLVFLGACSARRTAWACAAGSP